ncbi:uncharacterized protein SOCE836_067820 [Sorangium cellulosum]|uniref:Uncharacterized protein n=1 Tax=Sorangium cellulosum TaxID=56 RepID=A0A4P2QWR5_SORCE|nr:uncharacterized protein SOCE836_067820 [Sorangium cellulosum]WCQ93918.1 hypothetical protein NQZ70_06675 [Sorangium sp. Soce836]
MERGRFRGLGAVPSRCLEHTRSARRAGTFRGAGAREPRVPAAIVGALAFTQRPCFAQRRATELEIPRSLDVALMMRS